MSRGPRTERGETTPQGNELVGPGPGRISAARGFSFGLHCGDAEGRNGDSKGFPMECRRAARKRAAPFFGEEFQKILKIQKERKNKI
jgi:hypothetical protein